MQLFLGRPFTNQVRYLRNGDNIVVSVGKGSYIGGASFESATSAAHLMVGHYTSISYDNVFLIGMDHNYKSLSTFPMGDLDDNTPFAEAYEKNYKADKFGKTNKLQTIVGHDAWIGRGCTIMGGIRIGNGACVGTGSVVTKDVPPYAIVAGNPAKIIRYRFSDEIIAKLQSIKWWNWNKEDLQTIVDNIKTEADVIKFAEKYYNPEMDKPHTTELSQKISKLRQNGTKSFFLSLDGIESKEEAEFLLEHVFDRYLTFYKNNKKMFLIVNAISYKEVLQAFFDKISSESKTNAPFIFISDNGEVLESVLENTDYLLMTKSFESLVLGDKVENPAGGGGGKLIYAYEYEIFQNRKIVW